MEIRVLEYFLAVTREQSISAAAQSLHLSQPTLSRQLKEMEEQLGKQLLIRGNRKVTLTEEGRILRKRAEEIMELVHKTESEITLSDQSIAGDVYIGAGETDAVRLLARVAQSLQTVYPEIHFHISSGNSLFVMERLDQGLIDFGLLFNTVHLPKYEYLKLPLKDIWGVLMRRDAPLAAQAVIQPQDLWDKPLIMSTQETQGSELATWLKRDTAKLQVVATYNLIYNASLMVDEGLGYAITFDKLINTSGDSTLCFRPLFPRLEADIYIVWKKYQILSKAAEQFIGKLQEAL